MEGDRYIFSFLLLLLLILSQAGYGQAAKKERDIYTLLTTPYNLRPLALYRGQFQADGGYKFAVRTQSYNSGGDIENTPSKFTGSVYHYYLINMRFGLTDFVELGAETNIIRLGQREATTNYESVTATSTDHIIVNKLTETRGLGDILLMVTMRLPVKYKRFDFSATGGMFLPSSEYEPKKPTNTVTSLAASNTYNINYHYNYTNGFGVPVYLISGALKTGFKKFTAEAHFSFKTPKEEGTNIRWEENLVNRIFYYEYKSYSYLLNNSFLYAASVHYQATGWFNLYLNGSYENTKGGWTEFNGKKYRNEETSLLVLEPGFDLQISPGLTICQVAGFPAAGKNSVAPFYLFTTVRYSFFPFHR